MPTIKTMWYRQSGKCFYCRGDTYLPATGESRVDACARFGITHGARASRAQFKYRRATIEHLLRRADGGTNASHNLVMACQGCNSHRGAMSVHDFKRRVEQLIKSGKHWTMSPMKERRSAKKAKSVVAGLPAASVRADAQAQEQTATDSGSALGATAS